MKLKKIKENTKRETLHEKCNALQRGTKKTKVIKSEAETTTFENDVFVEEGDQETSRGAFEKTRPVSRACSPVTVFIGARAQKCIRMTSLIKAHDSVRTWKETCAA